MFITKPAGKASLSQRRLVCGVGINDATYITTYKDEFGKQQKCPYYVVWMSLIDRCFNASFLKKRPNYAGCTLENSWKIFSKFRAWMETQDWQGKHLDKDLINWDNKHYGPDTCLFISPELNNLLTLRGAKRGSYPLGVSKTTIKGHEYFTASCSYYGRQKKLGYFKTSEEAAEKYKQAKLAYINDLANREKDPRIRQALLNLH